MKSIILMECSPEIAVEPPFATGLRVLVRVVDHDNEDYRNGYSWAFGVRFNHKIRLGVDEAKEVAKLLRQAAFVAKMRGDG